MPEKKVLTGHKATAHGVKLARPEVIAAYPITPQSEISENLSEFSAEGKIDAKVFRIESEHSAMSSLIGASLAGARTFTATSSNGLYYMTEMLFFAAGARVPIVMAVANRAPSPPWSVWGDQSDSISQRDTGWLQIYVENCQEVLDTIIQAYKIVEKEDIRLPIMICLDGFTLTHVSEPVEIPDQDKVDEFLPPFDPEYSLAKSLKEEDPVCFSHITPPETSYMEYKYRQAEAAERASERINKVDEEFAEKFGRKYGGLFEEYEVDDAEAVLVTLGSISTTAKATVEEYRADGKKVGTIKLRSFRPFPSEELRKTLEDASVVGVIDREHSCDRKGAVYSEVAAALSELKNDQIIVNYVTGLGGREVRKNHIRTMLDSMLDILSTGEAKEKVEWVGVRK